MSTPSNPLVDAMARIQSFGGGGTSLASSPSRGLNLGSIFGGGSGFVELPPASGGGSSTGFPSVGGLTIGLPGVSGSSGPQSSGGANSVAGLPSTTSTGCTLTNFFYSPACLLRIVFLVLGLICILGAIYLFKPTQNIVAAPIRAIKEGAKTAVTTAALS